MTAARLGRQWGFVRAAGIRSSMPARLLAALFASSVGRLPLARGSTPTNGDADSREHPDYPVSHG